MHSTYKAKFRSKGAGGGGTSTMDTEPEGAPASSGGSTPAGSAREFIDTFSSTLLATFTPGKSGDSKPDERV